MSPYKMVKKLLIAMTFLSILLCNKVRGEERQRQKSALKWITKNKIQDLPGGWTNKNLVRRHEGRYTLSGTYCRVEVEGCFYPGYPVWIVNDPILGKVPLYGRVGNKDVSLNCQPITKNKIQPAELNFEVLYNPEGVSDYAWRSWPEGTGDLNFPLGVIKTDEDCNLMIGKYRDNDERALIDDEGYVYYHDEPFKKWHWDNNEYDLLVERTVKKIELLELSYEDPINRKSSRFEGGGDRSTSSHLLTNNDITETEISASLSMWYTNQKSWSHSVTFAIKFGVDVNVESPGKRLLGGASATYKFETSFSYSHGWAGATEDKRVAKQSVKKNVPPKHQIRVKMFMMQHIVDVPYTAKYRLTYENGDKKVVKDKGVLNNVFYSDSEVEVSEAESLIHNEETIARTHSPRTYKADSSSESHMGTVKAESIMNNVVYSEGQADANKKESRSNAKINTLFRNCLGYCIFIISVIQYKFNCFK